MRAGLVIKMAWNRSGGNKIHALVNSKESGRQSALLPKRANATSGAVVEGKAQLARCARSALFAKEVDEMPMLSLK